MSFALLSPEELKRELSISGRRGLALDVDETLGQANRHWLNALIPILGLPEGLTEEGIIRDYWNKMEHVPHWPKERVDEIAKDIFHSNDFQRTMPLIENANHAVNDIHKLLPIVAYITARPQTVAEGTGDWLRSHGFPQAPMIMKPTDEDHAFRNNWKASVLQYLHPEIMGIIDDNPGLAHELSPEYAGAVFIYAASDHPASGENRIPCPDWDAVKRAVQEFASKNPIK